MEICIPLAIGHFRSDVPLDPAHLPERFGLFTIILLGESLVSVMRGMKTQEDWSVAAASSALFGLAMAFTIWWWYFDGVEAAGERHVHSRQDSRLFYLWAYAHLPLYLGIGVAGVGMEHVIKFAPTHPLASTEAWMLCGGLAMAMAAVTTIAAARPRRHERALSTRRICAHVSLVAVTIAVGVAASQVHAAVVLLTLVVLAIGQLVVSLRLVTVPRRRIAVVAS